MLVTEPHHDDEPMPIPSTWRQPMLSDDDRWYRQQLGAAALGLIAGLIVVVPAVLWLSGFLGGPQKGPRPAVAETPPAAVKITVADTSLDTKVDHRQCEQEPDIRARRSGRAGHRADSRRPRRLGATLPTKAAPPPPEGGRRRRSRMEDLLSKAKRRIESGDIQGAREILEAPETASSGPMIFMLAETYDPNMLASWQTARAASTRMPTRRRHLYEQALALGEARAKQRLQTDWLGATN